MPTESLPEFVYRLASAEEWRMAEEGGAVPRREIDMRDGYFHLSTREQVLETANLHFKDATDLLALEVPLKPIAANMKFELAPKRGEAFPHFYGELTRDHVSAVIRLEKSGDGYQFGERL